MKDEGCVFSLPPAAQPLLHVVVREWRCARVSYRRTERQLLSGSLHAYESPPTATLLYAFTRSWMASRLTYRFFIFPHLAATKMMSKLTCVLRYVALLRLRLRPVLRSASAPLSLISFPILPTTSLRQDVCRRLILGYNR